VKNFTVKLTYVISLVTLTLFLVGFAWTLQNQFFSEKMTNVVKKELVNEEQEVQNKMIVALGDSLTRGTGDIEGKGYIGYLVEELENKTKEKITLQNLGVKGYRSENLVNQLKQTGVKDQLKNADLILITIGGNDLFQSGQTLMDLNLANIESLKQQYLKNLEKIVADLRILNKDATIFFVGLYNPFIDLDDAALMTKSVRQWNFETSELLDKHPQTVFVPTFDLFQLRVNDYLYTDKFHPNTKGYKLIAERVASLITW
jgi:lysophospholipase L1-like esterase